MKIFSYKIIFLLFIILTFFNKASNSSTVKIIAKIDNQIITNIDIDKENRYLAALNQNISKLDSNEQFKIAKDSVLREKIKKNELLKFIELNKEDKIFDETIKNIYQQLGLNSKEQFKEYLDTKKISYDEVYKKIEIETMWNQLIYSIYKDRIIINEDDLKKKIENNNKEQKLYKLSEIVFSFNSKEEIEKIYQNIKTSIAKIGFNETVLIYSISDSKNKNGSIDWLNENALSEKISKELINLKIGEITKPILIPSGALILKLDEIKIKKSSVDNEKELEKMINFEINSQLNNYSIAHFKKVKENLNINEY